MNGRTTPLRMGFVRGSKRQIRPGVSGSYGSRLAATPLPASCASSPRLSTAAHVQRTLHSVTSSTSKPPAELTASERPFGQLLDRWLEECERLDLSPTTIRTYQAQIKRTIRPRLGKLKLSQLTASHLDDLYGAMKDAGKSPKTIRNHHAIISAALHQAVRWGWVRTNVAEQAKPPRVAHRRVQAPSVDVVRDVIEEAERRDPRLAPFLMLAALTGMRRGELCALRWTDVDLDPWCHRSRSLCRRR